jgi:hypothetical protein
MSGGSWDYVSYKFEDTAHRLLGSKCPYRQALGRQILREAEALHAIEWVDSCDWGPGDEIELITMAVTMTQVAAEVSEQLRQGVEMAQSVLRSLGDVAKPEQER